jgi:hypothetical protein
LLRSPLVSPCLESSALKLIVDTGRRLVESSYPVGRYGRVDNGGTFIRLKRYRITPDAAVGAIETPREVDRRIEVDAIEVLAPKPRTAVHTEVDQLQLGLAVTGVRLRDPHLHQLHLVRGGDALMCSDPSARLSRLAHLDSAATELEDIDVSQALSRIRDDRTIAPAGPGRCGVVPGLDDIGRSFLSGTDMR